MILTAFLWGALMAIILVPPTSYIVSFIGGFIIGVLFYINDQN